MAGILSIGWYVPQGRRDRKAIAHDYGLAQEALDGFGLQSHTVAAECDHPSTMGAQAARAALNAAHLSPGDIDLLIFAGMTRDYPTPWVGAFGILHELGIHGAAGFDLNNRCTGLHDAIWVATSLVRSGSAKNVMVCAADRFDYLLGPQSKVGQISDAAYSAGAGAAIVGRGALNEIVAFSHLTNDDLSLHEQLCPKVGGTRRALDSTALVDGLHRWQNTMKLAQVSELTKYLLAADRHNITSVCKEAGFAEIDFLACSPLDIHAQLKSLAALGIGPEKTLLTLPQLGHMGPADSLVALGLAVATGRKLGSRVVMSTRSALYANALAIRAYGSDMGISAGGVGIDIAKWREDENQRLEALGIAAAAAS